MKQTKETVSSRGEKKKKSGSARFRLLPSVIFFCVLMLSVRIGVVWRSIVLPDEALKKEAAFSVSPVQAQTAPVPAVSEKQAGTSDKIRALETAAGIKKDETGKSFSQSELEILQKLAQRREELDVRERTIDQKAGVLKAAEAQMDVKIAKLKELEASIKDLVGIYDEKEKSRLANLVKIYSTMKPKEAARLFNDMEMSLLVRVFEQMKEAKSAPILALMDLNKASALTAELANKKKLPGYDNAAAEEKK